jgi:hypothetical protein
VAAASLDLHARCKALGSDLRGCFQLLGAHFAVDASLRPWLLKARPPDVVLWVRLLWWCDVFLKAT